MRNPVTTLTAFVVEKLETESLGRRIQIYRALADITPKANERRELTAMADSLAAIEIRHQQLLLNLKGGTTP